MTKLKFIEPIDARAVEKLPEGRGWFYEIKLDGYRCLAGRDSKRVTVWSRRANIFTTQFPRIARACEKLQPDTLIASFFNRSCYERDNGHKTHRAKRSCLFQAHYKDDDNLEGIRKREQEAIWQSTFSFPPDPHLATNTYGSFSFPYSLARRSISSFTFISWVSWNLRASASIRTSSRTRTESRIPSKVGPNRLSHFASLGSRHFVSLPLLLHFARGYHRLESEFELASHNEPHIGPRSNIQPCRFSLDVIVDKREYAYGRKSKMGTFTDALMAEAKKKGWTVISMKNDWKRIFAFEQ